jgi:hypothetical protein
MQGKTTLSSLTDADKNLSLDSLVARIGVSTYHHTPLQLLIRDRYDPESLGAVYKGIDDEGHTDAFAALIAEAVAPSDRLVVIDGPLSDAQAGSLQRILAGPSSGTRSG